VGDEVWSLPCQQIDCLACFVGGRSVVVYTRKILTDDKYLASGVSYQKNFPVVLTVNFDNRFDEMDAGCSESRHSDGHH